MKNNRPNYELIMLKSQSGSWWTFVGVLLNDIANTINIFKNKLTKNEKFNSVDLPQLRALYKQLRDNSKNNKETSKYSEVENEKQLVRDIFTILNSYYNETGISVGIQKRVTKSRFVTPGMPYSVTSYYFKVGKIPEYTLLQF
jgi:hypothetical protein